MSTPRAWGEPLPGPLDTKPHGVTIPEAQAMLAHAVDGLHLGAYHRRMLAWASHVWDQPTMAVLASIVWRARQAPVPR